MVEHMRIYYGVVTNYGEGVYKQKRGLGGGGKGNFTPTKKRGGGRKSLATLKGGTKGFEVVLTQELEVFVAPPPSSP